MPQFLYRARDLRGKLTTGYVEAEGIEAAVTSLREQHYFVVMVRPAPEKKREVTKASLFQKPPALRDLALFCRQFATMVGAGVPLLRCLDVLMKQTRSKTLRRILQEVTAETGRGRSLSEAFKAHQKYLPEVFTSMLAAGELSGTLEEALGRLATYFEKEHAFREKIKSAATYPVLVAGIALVVMVVLLLFVVPIFADIFNQMGASLPLATRILVGAQLLLVKYGWVLLLAIFTLFFALRQFRTTRQGREFTDRLILRLPVIGPLINKTAVARFARTLATLLRSGVPLIQSLETVERVVGNAVVAGEIAAARENIREGEGMAPILEQSKVFPPLAVSMIAVGEESGAVDELLEKVAFFYEEEAETAVTQLSSTIEPLLIIGVGVMVAFIALSIYLPLFGMAGALQSGVTPGGMP